MVSQTIINKNLLKNTMINFRAIVLLVLLTIISKNCFSRPSHLANNTMFSHSVLMKYNQLKDSITVQDAIGFIKKTYAKFAYNVDKGSTIDSIVEVRLVENKLFLFRHYSRPDDRFLGIPNIVSSAVHTHYLYIFDLSNIKITKKHKQYYIMPLTKGAIRVRYFSKQDVKNAKKGNQNLNDDSLISRFPTNIEKNEIIFEDGYPLDIGLDTINVLFIGDNYMDRVVKAYNFLINMNQGKSSADKF
jgi:hypothetical protein